MVRTVVPQQVGPHLNPPPFLQSLRAVSSSLWVLRLALTVHRHALRGVRLIGDSNFSLC